MYEGAQGTLIDLTLGSYPFVTSSHPGIIGIAESFGMNQDMLGRIIGVTKAFPSKVGEGPMPTEVFGEDAARLRGTGANPWDEFGTVTRRPRRVGLPDGVLAEYAVRLNSVTEIAMTKLDILAGMNPVRLCVAYDINGQIVRQVHRVSQAALADAKPIYEDLPGWEEIPPGSIHSWDELPQNALRFISRFEEIVGKRVTVVSNGPAREHTIFRG